jgi:uncharacterized protein YoxC
MSTGEWFTLNPLNLKNYQTEIDNLNGRLTNVETTLTQLDNQVQGMVFKILNLQDQVLANTTSLQNLTNQVSEINTNVSSLTTSLTSLTNTVNQFSNQITGITNNLTALVSQYQPIYSFYANNLTFTDFHGHTAPGEMHEFWYRPIKLLPDTTFSGGEDLKFLLLELRQINIPNIPQNGNFFFSNILPLPILFVNNNTFRVFWQSASDGGSTVMTTAQAYYIVNNAQINNWILAVLPTSNNGVNNDSACFIIMYI